MNRRTINIVIICIGLAGVGILVNSLIPSEPKLSTEYQYKVNNADCPKLARLLDNSKTQYDIAGGIGKVELKTLAYQIIRSDYMDRCNEELPLNLNYFPVEIMEFKEYKAKLFSTAKDKTYALPYDYLKNVDKFDNKSTLGWCLNSSFSGYDKEKERCYWIGTQTLNNNRVPLNIYVSETESSYDLTKTAMADCYADGGGWDRECYYRIIDDGWCGLPHELWSPTKSIEDATCYGDSQLDDLKEIKTI